MKKPTPAEFARVLVEADFPLNEPDDHSKARAFDDMLMSLVTMATWTDEGPVHGGVLIAVRGLLEVAANALKEPDDQSKKEV